MRAKSGPRVVLRANKYRIPLFLVVLRAVYTGIKNHPQFFASPSVDLGFFLSQIEALASAQQAMKGWPKAPASDRDLARDAVFTSAELLRSYVQALCDGNVAQAEQIAQAAGMRLRAGGGQSKPVLRAVQIPGGLVRLYANASMLTQNVGTRFFNWEYSLDGGRSWISAPCTNKSKTTLAGLPTLTPIRFRVSATNSKLGTGDWSPEIAFTLV